MNSPLLAWHFEDVRARTQLVVATLFLMVISNVGYAIFPCKLSIVGWLRDSFGRKAHSDGKFIKALPELTGLRLLPDLAPPEDLLVLPNGVILPFTPRPADWYTQARYHHPPTLPPETCAIEIPICRRAAKFSSMIAAKDLSGLQNFERLLEIYTRRITGKPAEDLIQSSLIATRYQLKVAAIRHLVNHEFERPRNSVSQALKQFFIAEPGKMIAVANLSALKNLIATLPGTRAEHAEMIAAIDTIHAKWKRSDYLDDLVGGGDLAAFRKLGDDFKNSYDNEFQTVTGFRWLEENSVGIGLYNWWSGTFEVLANGEIEIGATILQDTEFRRLGGKSDFIVSVKPEGTPTLARIDGAYAAFYFAARELELASGLH